MKMSEYALRTKQPPVTASMTKERSIMSTTLFYNADIYRTSSRSFTGGDILIGDDRILGVSEGPSAWRDTADRVIDVCGRKIIPGLVDVHTHGRAGGDFSSAPVDMMLKMSESYLRSGVTTLLPTLASAPLDDLRTAIGRINQVKAMEADPAYRGRLAHFAGTHLEGRYLNVQKRGAHAPELLFPLDADEMASLISAVDGARHVSAALELDADGCFLRRALSLGATVSLGHTAATYAQAMDAFIHGCTAATHLFNAMLPLHHREGGAVCAALLSPDVSCELICDGFHIAPEMVRLAGTMKKDHLVLITDSMEATGCADGEYTIAGMPVTVKDGKARTHDGAIAGSTLSMWKAVKNYRDFAGVSFEEAVYAATMAPAVEVGLTDEIGSLEPGKRADLLILGDYLTIDRVMVGGVFAVN